MRIARRIPVLVVAYCASLVALGPGALIARADGITDLDDDASQWSIFYDCDQPCAGQGDLANVGDPSEDGSSLRIRLLGGTPAVGLGLHSYRTLPPQNSAMHFTINYDFYFHAQDIQHVQALEFTMNKWIVSGPPPCDRWEWALQWANIEGNTWRVWDGSTVNWIPTGISANVTMDRWHSILIDGSIVGDRVQYNSFTFDQTNYDLSSPNYNFAKRMSQECPFDRLVVAVQLDGDGQVHPYDTYLDHVDFTWE